MTYSIWITHEKSEDNTFDINVWDEVENERCDELEESHFQTLKDAELRLANIVNNNPEVIFSRLKNEIK